MTDYDSIWRMQDEIRTVVNAVLGITYRKGAPESTFRVLRS